MIISASRRTDIPAFFSEWFMQSVRAGVCEVSNPVNPRQVSSVSLKPGEVDGIVFWTRDSRPLLPSLDELDSLGFVYYFLFTINGYPRVFEPHCPELREAVAAFKELAERVGPKRVIWRYDPIIISNLTDAEYHLERVDRIAEELKGYTQRMIISVLDIYRDIGSRLKALEEEGVFIDGSLDAEDLWPVIKGIAGIAKSAGIEVRTCAEREDYTPVGAPPGRCIDPALMARLRGSPVSSRKDPGQRKDCLCAVSRDIGVYNTCPAGCVYCYARR